MDGYFNLERVKQAHGLCDSIREYNRNRTDPKKQPKLDSVELTVLMVLARKMGRKTDLTTGEIENGCRAALVTLEHETLMERTAIGRALGNLIDAGFITKTYDRCRLTELTKEGQRRKALGLSLDCPEKNNYQRRPLGRPRDDKSDLGQWKHCVYHLVPAVWDGVVFDSREVPVAPAPVSAEDQAPLDSMDLPVAPKKSTGTSVTKPNADEAFRQIQYYFEGHNTLANQSEKDARRSMNEACVELAQRALSEGDINYANNFLWWLMQRRNEVFAKLMDGTIKNLGVSFGLPKYIAELWDEFVLEKDDKIVGQNATEDDSTNEETGEDAALFGPVDPQPADEDEFFSPPPPPRPPIDYGDDL
jgi:DNA-binding MarR family transcriptional regulator